MQAAPLTISDLERLVGRAVIAQDTTERTLMARIHELDALVAQFQAEIHEKDIELAELRAALVEAAVTGNDVEDAQPEHPKSNGTAAAEAIAEMVNVSATP